MTGPCSEAKYSRPAMRACANIRVSGSRRIQRHISTKPCQPEAVPHWNFFGFRWRGDFSQCGDSTRAGQQRFVNAGIELPFQINHEFHAIKRTQTEFI